MAREPRWLSQLADPEQLSEEVSATPFRALAGPPWTRTAGQAVSPVRHLVTSTRKPQLTPVRLRPTNRFVYGTTRACTHPSLYNSLPAKYLVLLRSSLLILNGSNAGEVTFTTDGGAEQETVQLRFPARIPQINAGAAIDSTLVEVRGLGCVSRTRCRGTS